jgi:uncharacterized membrane protein YraQ (UPF0718 family)
MKMPSSRPALFGAYGAFLLISLLAGFKPGIAVGENLAIFVWKMLGVLPPAFIFVGLLEVWVKRETVEKHMGKGSGLKGYFWALLLAGTAVGGIYVSLPVAAILYKKGASLGLLFTYVNASMICKIPMTLLEISCLGLPFTLVRYLVSLPVLILASTLMGRFLEKRGYGFSEPS